MELLMAEPIDEANPPSPDPFTPEGDTPSFYEPPWPMTRAPGTQRPIIAAELVAINPWLPVIALLTEDKVAMLNRESAARQAAAYYTDSVRCV